VMTCTGAGPSASIRLMFEPVMTVFSVEAVCARASDETPMATMTASVLNEMRGRQFVSKDANEPSPWWFYHAEADEFEVKAA